MRKIWKNFQKSGVTYGNVSAIIRSKITPASNCFNVFFLGKSLKTVRKKIFPHSGSKLENFDIWAHEFSGFFQIFNLCQSIKSFQKIVENLNRIKKKKIKFLSEWKQPYKKAQVQSERSRVRPWSKCYGMPHIYIYIYKGVRYFPKLVFFFYARPPNF